MKSHFSKIVLVLGFALLTIMKTSQADREKENQRRFAADLFEVISRKAVNRNTIISPIAIRTSLALLYEGAALNTASEIQKTLYLGSKEETRYEIKAIKEEMRLSTNSALRMVNGFFVSDRIKIKRDFIKRARSFFTSSIIDVNFLNNKAAAQSINQWTSQHTETKLTNVVAVQNVEVSTSVILVSAVYLVAKWVKPFKKSYTTEMEFHTSPTKSTVVQMMTQSQRFHFGELENLDAKAVVLPFSGSDIKMLLLLPNQLDGLFRLERQLKNVSLTDLALKLRLRDVRLSLPRFKFLSKIWLQETMQQLGVRRLFTAAADFSPAFENWQGISVSRFRHNIRFEVNEFGSSAGVHKAEHGVYRQSLSGGVFEFKADHPFFFAILDFDDVFLVGHVKEF